MLCGSELFTLLLDVYLVGIEFQENSGKQLTISYYRYFQYLLDSIFFILSLLDQKQTHLQELLRTVLDYYLLTAEKTQLGIPL